MPPACAIPGCERTDTRYCGLCHAWLCPAHEKDWIARGKAAAGRVIDTVRRR